MITGYNIREGSRMIAERIALLGEGDGHRGWSPSPSGSPPRPARLRVEDHGPLGVRRLVDGERAVNGRVYFCEAWRSAA